MLVRQNKCLSHKNLHEGLISQRVTIYSSKDFPGYLNGKPDYFHGYALTIPSITYNFLASSKSEILVCAAYALLDLELLVNLSI